MADDTIKSMAVRIALDSGSFRDGMKDLKNQMSVIDSSFKASVSGLKDWGNNLDLLKGNSSALSEKIGVQETVVSRYKQGLEAANGTLQTHSQKMLDLKERLSNVTLLYEQSKNALGANDEYTKTLKSDMDALQKQYDSSERVVRSNSNAVQGYSIQLNNAQGELNGLKGELSDNQEKIANFGQHTEEAANKESNAAEKTNTLKERMKDMGSRAVDAGKELAKLAAEGIAAIGTAAAEAGKQFFDLSKEAVSNAQSITKNAEVTGLSVRSVQELSYASNELGVDFETLTGAQARLTKAMDAAGDTKKGPNAQAKAFAELGIQVRDAHGNLRSATDVMNEAFTALNKMPDATERDAVSMKLFGKSAMEMNPLIKAGGDRLKELTEQADKTGAVMSDKAVAGLNDFGHQLDSLKESFTGIAGTALSGLMPALQGLIGMGRDLATSFSNAVNTGDWTGFAGQVGNTLSGVVGQATRILPEFIKIGTSIVTSLVTSIAKAVPVILPQLTQGLLTLVQAIVGILSTCGPQLVATAISAIGDLVTGLLQALPQLLQAAIQIVLALVQGISTQLPTLIPAAVNCVLTLVQTLVNNIPMLIDAAITLILALVKGIISAIPQIVAAAPKIITSLVNGIVQAVPKLLDAALQIILAFIKFLPTYYPMLVKAMPQILSTIVAGLIDAVGQIYKFIPVLFSSLWDAVKTIDWKQLGVSIVAGLAAGLKNGASAIWKALKSAVSGAIESFKKFFGINSPSKYMADEIGVHLGGGIAAGLDNSSGTVGKSLLGLKSQLSMGLGNLSVGGTLAYAGGPAASRAPATQAIAAGSNGTTITINFNGSVRSSQDIKDIAALLERNIATRNRGLGNK